MIKNISISILLFLHFNLFGQFENWNKFDNDSITIVKQVDEDILLFKNINTKLFGCIDTTGNLLIASNYLDLYSFSDGIIPAQNKDHKWGFINSSNKEIVSFIYDEVTNFRNGIARVKINGKSGLINAKGESVIKTKYEELNISGKDKIKFRRDSIGFGLLDLSGKLILKDTFDNIYGLPNELFVAEKNKKCRIYNDLGISLNDSIYKSIRYHKKSGLLEAYKNGNYCILDQKGLEILPCKYDRIKWYSSGFFCVRKDKKYGVLDTLGKIVVPLIYKDIEHLSNDYFKVQHDYGKNYIYSISEGMNDKMYQSISVFKEDGYLTLTKDDSVKIYGLDLLPKTNIVYNEIRTFSNGKAVFSRDSICGFLNSKFEEEIALDCDWAYPYKKGYAVVKKGQTFSVIDTSGKLQFPFINQKYIFRTDKIFVTEEQYGGPYFFYNEKGHSIIHFPVVSYREYDEGFVVGDNIKEGFLSLQDMKFNIPPTYDKIEPKRDYLEVRINNKLGIISVNNKTIVPCEFDEIKYYRGGVAVKKTEKYGFYDYDGNLLREIIYNDIEELDCEELNGDYDLQIDLKRKGFEMIKKGNR